MPRCTHCSHESPLDFDFCPRCGTQQISRGDPLLGRTLAGKYRVLEEVGAGSMGRVYRGEHTALHKRVALKILHPDLRVTDEAMRRFQREGIAAGRIDHPNAIQIFDFERTDEGLVFLAMELVEGVDLETWLARHGPLPPADAVELAAQLLDTLSAAHAHGIVHRDLKPANLMVVDGPRGRQLKVLDFGLSKLLDHSPDLSLQTLAGRVLGTPLYMAPEQWRGDPVDARTDLYAVALLVYEMVAGRPPFEGRDVTEVMAKTTGAQPPSLAQTALQRVPRDLDALVRKGLAKDPDDRFGTAEEMAAALAAIDFDRVATAPRSRRRPAARAPKPRPRHAGWLAIAGLAAVGAVTAWWWLHGGAPLEAAAARVRDKPASARSDAERSYIALLDQAEDDLRRGDAAGALDTVDHALHSSCADAEGLVMRGDAYRALGDRDTARADYEEATARDPGYAGAYAALGWWSVDAGDAEAARPHFERALAIDGGCGAAIAGYAALELKDGDAKGACARLQSALASGNDDALLHLWYGRALLAADRVDEAADAFVAAKRKDAALWDAWEGLGDCQARRGDVEAAVRQYRGILDAGHGATPLKQKCVEMLLRLDRVRDADALLGDALASEPQRPGLHLLRALVQQADGDLPAAIGSLHRALDLGCDDAGRAWLLLAQLSLQAGKAAPAIEACQRAADAGVQRPELDLTRGLAQLANADYSGAADSLRRAAELAPNDPQVHYALGVLAMDYLGDPKAALEQFAAYRACGGDDPKVAAWELRLRER